MTAPARRPGTSVAEVLATPFVVLAFILYLGGMALGALLLPPPRK